MSTNDSLAQNQLLLGPRKGLRQAWDVGLSWLLFWSALFCFGFAVMPPDDSYIDRFLFRGGIYVTTLWLVWCLSPTAFFWLFGFSLIGFIIYPFRNIL